MTAGGRGRAVVGTPTPTASAPTLSALHESATTWLVGNGLRQLSARRRKPPVGTTFSFGLDQAASVTLTFQAHMGTNNVRFQGRLSATKKLKPGRYIVVVVATNVAGRSSAPSSLGFTIAKR